MSAATVAFSGFSKDKTPYKTAMHVRFPAGDGKIGAGFYLRIASSKMGIAAGAWGFDPEHPNAELLRHKSLFANTELDLPAALFGSKAVRFVADHFARRLSEPSATSFSGSSRSNRRVRSSTHASRSASSQLKSRTSSSRSRSRGSASKSSAGSGSR